MGRVVFSFAEHHAAEKSGILGQKRWPRCVVRKYMVRLGSCSLREHRAWRIFDERGVSEQSLQLAHAVEISFEMRFSFPSRITPVL